jgi:ferritin-like metal-binding protein YciE
LFAKENHMRHGGNKGRNKGEYDSHLDFARSITAIYGLNLALSYENAAVDRLEQRVSQCTVPELKKNLMRHLKQTKEQQERLKERIRVLAGFDIGSDNSPAAAVPTAESGRLPIPEPPPFLKSMMDEVGTEREKEVLESINDLIIERAEAIMYRAGIQALELLKIDNKTINALKKNLSEEEAFAKWLEKNNPRIAKKLMKQQMLQGKKKKQKRIVDITAAAAAAAEERKETTPSEAEAATAAAAGV